MGVLAMIVKFSLKKDLSFQDYNTVEAQNDNNQTTCCITRILHALKGLGYR